MGVMLSVKDLVVNYGAINAIKGISFDVNEGEIVTLIGANGAGKTTTLHAVSRLLKPKQGEISFCGQPISSMEAHKIIQLGLTQVPEGRRVFSQLTVQQNLALGAYTRKDGADAVAADYEMVFQRLPRLKERRRQIAGTLSGGEQQMLAIGRALMCKPKMLLLDEPSMGLSPLLVQEIFSIIHDVNQSGWWSRTPRWRWRSRTGPMSWRQVPSSCPATRMNWPITTRCAKRIWAVETAKQKGARPCRGHALFFFARRQGRQ